MYDMPPVNAANDAFWAEIRAILGFGPQHLNRHDDLWDQWLDPDLIFSQTCGLPFRARLHSHVQYLCTPDYGLSDCPAGHYYSVVIAPKGRSVPDAPRVAINDPLSQSGWAALHDWATTAGVPLSKPQISGAHAQSIALVQTDQADLAAVDVVTWNALVQSQSDVSNIDVIAKTTPTPSLPYICSASQDASMIRAAVYQAFETLSLETTTQLGVKGLVEIDLAAYLSIPIPPVIE